jgi:hypothetical protein
LVSSASLNLIAANPIIIFYEATPRFGTAQRARGIRAFGAPNAFLDDSLAHAFYLLPDLEGSIRSNSRPPCYFFIDPSI